MYKFLIFCFFLVANLSVAQSVSVWNIFDTVQKGVLIAAHRGDFKNYPENSIPGILSCITQGVDIVEIDVQKTSDGHFVLMHDPKLNRTTNGKGKVSQRTLKYILGLKLKDAKGNLTNY